MLLYIDMMRYGIIWQVWIESRRAMFFQGTWKVAKRRVANWWTSAFAHVLWKANMLGRCWGVRGWDIGTISKICEDIETTHGIRNFSLIHQKISKDIHINPYQSHHIKRCQKISCQVSFAIISSVTPWSVSFTRNPRWATGESRRSSG